MLKYYLVLSGITMEAISLKLENSFLEDIQETMKKHRYTTKTEFIREAIRDKIRELEKEEALLRVKQIYGASKKKTSDKDLRDVGEKAFVELEEEFNRQ
jgi:Arc/MetJ-type ribon-helix-helix transcriptional regulator